MDKFLRNRIYKNRGYQLVYFLVDASQYGSKNFEMCSAFTYPGNSYIGNSKTAYFLCVKKGIVPQPIKETPPPINFENLSTNEQAFNLLAGINSPNYSYNPICQIGFCKKDKSWYGWSHRAIYGFTVGSKFEFGCCGFVPKNEKEHMEQMINFWARKEDGIKILRKEYSVSDPHQQESGIGNILEYEEILSNGQSMVHLCWERHPEWGRGNWVAKTLEDAKQMAIDFAEDVA